MSELRTNEQAMGSILRDKGGEKKSKVMGSEINHLRHFICKTGVIVCAPQGVGLRQ